MGGIFDVSDDHSRSARDLALMVRPLRYSFSASLAEASRVSADIRLLSRSIRFLIYSLTEAKPRFLARLLIFLVMVAGRERLRTWRIILN